MKKLKAGDVIRQTIADDKLYEQCVEDRMLWNELRRRTYKLVGDKCWKECPGWFVAADVITGIID